MPQTLTGIEIAPEIGFCECSSDNAKAVPRSIEALQPLLPTEGKGNAMSHNKTPTKLNSANLPSPEALPADGFTRWNSLRAFVPFSRETVRKREKEGRFPRRQRLGSERCAAWPNREIHRWIADPANYRAEG